MRRAITLPDQRRPVRVHWEPSPHFLETYMASSPAGRLLVRRTNGRGENRWLGKIDGREVGRWFSLSGAQAGVEFIAYFGTGCCDGEG